MLNASAQNEDVVSIFPDTCHKSVTIVHSNVPWASRRNFKFSIHCYKAHNLLYTCWKFGKQISVLVLIPSGLERLRTQFFTITGLNCVRNRSRPDEIDIETKICTFLKSEFYFRFCWPPTYWDKPEVDYRFLRCAKCQFISFATVVDIFSHGSSRKPELRYKISVWLCTQCPGSELTYYLV